MSKRLQARPIILGEFGNSKHICYQDRNNLFEIKNGVLCKMENIILDPSKWRPDGYVYQGPQDFNNKGFPLLSKGFFNMKGGKKNNIYPDVNYNRYFNSWNYDYKDDENNLEELAPGKIVFFFSRNQDSPNIFHGGSEFINALSLIYLLDIKPENIQLVFLESMEIRNDPLHELYKNIISRGGTPIHIPYIYVL